MPTEIRISGKTSRCQARALVAISVCLAAVLLAHAYAAGRAEGALDAVEGNLRFGGFRLANALPPGDPEYYTYELTMVVENPTGVDVTIIVHDVEVTIGEINLGNIIPSAKKIIDARSKLELIGEFRISEDTIDGLRSQGETDLRLRGGMKVSSACLWVRRARDLPEGIDLSRGILFE
jgi:hypothetical protein